MKIDFGGVRQPNRSNEPTRTSDDLALPGILIDVQFLQRANITGRKHRLILCNSFKRSTALSGAFKPSLALELDCVHCLDSISIVFNWMICDYNQLHLWGKL
ncbi:hypothetical protein YC2023_118857 [Brassica napus]